MFGLFSTQHSPLRPHVPRSFSLLARFQGIALFAPLAFSVVAGCATETPVHSGSVIFETCAPCHGKQAQGNQMYLAPAIAGLPAWYTSMQLKHFQTGVRGGHADDVGGLRMRPLSRTLRSKAAVDAVATYIENLPATDPKAVSVGGDATKGQGAYALCIACHAADGKGVKAQGGPNLTIMSDWYMETQLRNFRAGIRGVHPDDEAGKRMKAMSATIAGEQGIKDVVAYIMTLK